MEVEHCLFFPRKEGEEGRAGIGGEMEEKEGREKPLILSSPGDELS